MQVYNYEYHYSCAHFLIFSSLSVDDTVRLLYGFSACLCGGLASHKSSK